MQNHLNHNTQSQTNYQKNDDLNTALVALKKILSDHNEPAIASAYHQIEKFWPQIESALQLVTRLRGPGGCPWDREQNHLSIRQYLIEEAYETLDALDFYQSLKDRKELAKSAEAEGRFVPIDGTMPKEKDAILKEELGDLLLQILLHSQLAWERGSFHFGDVAQTMTDKLIYRHPHVFGKSMEANNSEQVLANWELLKKKERDKKQSQNSAAAGLLDSLPKSLPSLQRASRIGEKAKNVGFDWPNVEGVWEKVQEEWRELNEAMASGDELAIDHELGDLFFSLSQFARWKGTPPEDVHRRAIERFEERFRLVEEDFRNQNRSMHDASLAELENSWQNAKKALAKKAIHP